MSDELTREKIMERGGKALALLHDATFQSVMQEIKEGFEMETFLTAPGESERREALYHQHVALQTILATLATRVHAMNAILEEDAEKNDAAEKNEQ